MRGGREAEGKGGKEGRKSEREEGGGGGKGSTDYHTHQMRTPPYSDTDLPQPRRGVSTHAGVQWNPSIRTPPPPIEDSSISRTLSQSHLCT